MVFPSLENLFQNISASFLLFLRNTSNGKIHSSFPIGEIWKDCVRSEEQTNRPLFFACGTVGFDGQERDVCSLRLSFSEENRVGGQRELNRIAEAGCEEQNGKKEKEKGREEEDAISDFRTQKQRTKRGNSQSEDALLRSSWNILRFFAVASLWRPSFLVCCVFLSFSPCLFPLLFFYALASFSFFFYFFFAFHNKSKTQNQPHHKSSTLTLWAFSVTLL